MTNLDKNTSQLLPYTSVQLPYMREGKINVVGFFSLSLLVLLTARPLVDRIGLGFVVGLILIFMAALRLCTLRSIDKKIILTFLFFLSIIGIGYANAVIIHGEPFFSLRGVVRYSTYIFIFILSYYSIVKINHVYFFMTIVVIIQIIVSLIEKLHFSEFRPHGTLINSNHISYMLVLYFSISLIYYRNYIFSIFTILFSLFVGGLGGVLGLLIVGFGYLSRKANCLTRLLATILMPLFLIASFFALEDRFEEQSDIGTIEERLDAGYAGGGGSFVWRVVTWKLMLDELNEKDGMLFGQGIDYASVASPYFLQASTHEPHNDYVRIVLEFGLIGLIIYILMYLYAVKALLKMGRTDALPLALGWCLIALAIGQLVGNIIVQSTLWWFFFAFLGAYLAQRRRTNRFAKT